MCFKFFLGGRLSLMGLLNLFFLWNFKTWSNNGGLLRSALSHQSCTLLVIILLTIWDKCSFDSSTGFSSHLCSVCACFVSSEHFEYMAAAEITAQPSWHSSNLSTVQVLLYLLYIHIYIFIYIYNTFRYWSTLISNRIHLAHWVNYM